MSGEAMIFKIKNKTNNKPKFLHHKNSFLIPALVLPLCQSSKRNSMPISGHFNIFDVFNP